MYTLFVLFCISVLGLPQASAETDEPCPYQAFHIKGIEVSARADTGSEARNIATEDGLNQAWAKLTQRLLLEEIAEPDNASRYQDLVDYVRIGRETVLPKRYIARFDYCFDRAKTRKYFAEKNVRHAELVSAPMLVLPVWNSVGQPRIWRQPNPWGKAWLDVLEGRNGLVMLKMTDSLATERAIAPEAVIDMRRDAIAKAAQLETAEKVIVTVITPEVNGDDMTVTVSASLYTREGMLESEFYSLDSLTFPISSTAETMRWLVTEIENGLEKVWRSVNMISTETASDVMLSVPAATITQWRGRLATLRGLAPVETLSVVQLNAGGGVVRVSLAGSVQSLVYALEPSGLAIEKGVGEDGAVTFTLVARNS